MSFIPCVRALRRAIEYLMYSTALRHSEIERFNSTMPRTQCSCRLHSLLESLNGIGLQPLQRHEAISRQARKRNSQGREVEHVGRKDATLQEAERWKSQEAERWNSQEAERWNSQEANR